MGSFFRNYKGQRISTSIFPSYTDTGVLFVHGFTGDKTERGLFDYAASTLKTRGYTCLTFSMAGTGFSDDEILTIQSQARDLHSAIDYFKEVYDIEKLGILSLSLGGLISTLVPQEKVDAHVWWAPVTAARKDPYKKFSPAQLEELSKEGYLTVEKESLYRSKIKDSNSLLKYWGSINQESLLSRIEKPVLILHGDKDERIPISDSKSAIQYLPKGSELNIIQGSDHHMLNHATEYILHSLDWFDKYLV